MKHRRKPNTKQSMKTLYFKKRALLVFGLLLIVRGSAQFYNNIDVTFVDPNTAANILLGNSSGVQISNASFTGAPQQLGSFSGAGGYIGMNNGIILTTGDSRLAETVNRNPIGPSCVYTSATLSDGTTLSIGHSFRAEVDIFTGYSDPDLNALGGNPYNSAVLEFDFIPNATAISFQFLFGSEEYEEYVGTGYNDVFGFFVSGPGISGTYSNGGVNIATVPATGQPISVNTINAGSNSQYFIANVCNMPNVCPNGCCPCPNPNFQYDGYTTIMTASLDGLECNETYHMRIGITNINDEVLGSAVFIKAGSFANNFNAGPVQAEPEIVCEGDMLTLLVEGEQEYEYTWKDVHGNVVSTEQQVTITATTDGPPYTVTVVDPATGCNKTLEVDPTIHIAANEKPYTKGINNNGDFEYYVPAGVPFAFEIQSFDADNENVLMTLINVPTLLTSTLYNSNANQAGFLRPYVNVTGAIPTPGEYTFQVYLEDDNICGSENETYTFKIIVLCPDCYGTTYYERRGLNTTTFPFLPDVTEAQGNIVAGDNVDPTQTNGNVSVIPDVGTVAFYSAQSVNLQPGFIVLPGAHFIAEIKEVCDEDCNDCCKDGFTGFTISKENVPDIFTPNGDGINDYWYIPDPEHPNCAFNIMGFHLTIYNREGNVVHDAESHTELCCFYKAPGDAYPNMQFSSIFWDGRVNWPAMGGPYVSAGVYNYVLTLYGCENYEETWSGTISVY